MRSASIHDFPEPIQLRDEDEDLPEILLTDDLPEEEEEDGDPFIDPDDPGPTEDDINDLDPNEDENADLTENEDDTD